MSLTGNADSLYKLTGKVTSIPRIDNTLTKEDQAAEAKATGEAIGDSGTYSIESYLASVSQKPDCSEEFLNLVDKMVKYGDSSRAYFKR